jgi:hypothetical protein
VQGPKPFQVKVQESQCSKCNRCRSNLIFANKFLADCVDISGTIELETDFTIVDIHKCCYFLIDISFDAGDERIITLIVVPNGHANLLGFKTVQNMGLITVNNDRFIANVDVQEIGDLEYRFVVYR